MIILILCVMLKKMLEAQYVQLFEYLIWLNRIKIDYVL